MLFILCAELLMGCGKEEITDVSPALIAPDASCALDGMLLAYHEGPKSQVLRKNGQRVFYCDTKEVFTELLDPVRRNRIAGVWFQALDEKDWAAHADGWAVAESLHFVAGSKKMGAMGPTIAPFESLVNAEKFAADYGGAIYRLADIDEAVMEQLKRQGMEELSR